MSRDGRELLRRAAAKGNTKEIRALLKAQPKLAEDWKPVMDAAYRGDAATIVALIKGGVNPNVISGTAHRYRPLHRVIESKKTAPRGRQHVATAKALLERGADPLARGTFNRVTAVQLAAMDDAKFLPVLLPHVNELDIFHAAAVADEHRVATLLEEEPALATAHDANGWTPLAFCCASALHTLGDKQADALVRMGRRLLDAGAPHSAGAEFPGGWTLSPLYFCAGRQNNPRLAEVLLKAGARPFDGEALYHASDEMHVECLDLFDRYCERSDIAKEATACLPGQLHWRRTRGMAWLLDHGADPNWLHPRDGNSALHQAVMNGLRDDVVALLLRHGADPMRENADGKTAVDLAKGKSPRIAELLRRGTASTEAENKTSRAQGRSANRRAARAPS